MMSKLFTEGLHMLKKKKKSKLLSVSNWAKKCKYAYLSHTEEEAKLRVSFKPSLTFPFLTFQLTVSWIVLILVLIFLKYATSALHQIDLHHLQTPLPKKCQVNLWWALTECKPIWMLHIWCTRYLKNLVHRPLESKCTQHLYINTRILHEICN